MTADPFAGTTVSTNKDPYDSNQAIPTLLLGRYRATLAQRFPGLILERVDRFSMLAYPLSGGFQPWCLLPKALARPLLQFEWFSHGVFGRLAAFRLLAVLRKSGDTFGDKASADNPTRARVACSGTPLHPE
jgi:hypothetical protein